MTIMPYLLDARPRYLGDAGRESLLLLPGPDGGLAHELAQAVAAVTNQPPGILPAFAPDERYNARIRAACPGVGDILRPEDIHAVTASFDPSDVVLVVSASRVPSRGVDLRALCMAASNDARMARHLLAFEASSSGTKELVQSSHDGRLQRIQRYFEPMTWPFPSGVVASFVPVACLRMLSSPTLTNLDQLRHDLSARGIASADVPLHGESFDLTDEAGGLALMEHWVARAWKARRSRRTSTTPTRVLCSPQATIHDTARLIGPVCVAGGAVVGAGALIVGPSLIAAGARVEADAVVAQCLLLPNTTIAPAVTVRHRVAVSRADRPSDGVQRRHGARRGASRSSGARGSQRHRVDYDTIKTAVDRVVAIIALVVLSPLLLLLALLVRLSSPGPIFFGDRREGMNGRVIRCWKFRSMRTNADAMQRALAAQQQMDGPQFKMDVDPRVTRVGRILRGLNLDELPQLWNVACGEMSFVGPRPSPFRENQICVPWRQGRLSVRPGITGLWQICRHDRALGDFHQWIQYDLLYVRNLSFALDLRILVATVRTLGGRWPVPISRLLGPEANGMSPERASMERPLSPPRSAGGRATPAGGR